jgi:hypothetical protein
MKRRCELLAFFAVVAAATRLFAAPPEPVQRPVPTPGIGVDPTVVSTAAILQREHSFLIPNLKAGISVVKSALAPGTYGIS